MLESYQTAVRENEAHIKAFLVELLLSYTRSSRLFVAFGSTADTIQEVECTFERHQDGWWQVFVPGEAGRQEVPLWAVCTTRQRAEHLVALRRHSYLCEMVELIKANLVRIPEWGIPAQATLHCLGAADVLAVRIDEHCGAELRGVLKKTLEAPDAT